MASNIISISVFLLVPCMSLSLSADAIQERIILDFEMLGSVTGVPIDFSYNETISENKTFVSAPGCPKSMDGKPWVYFGSPPMCHSVGYMGPCPSNRLLSVGDDHVSGICTCWCITSWKTNVNETSHQNTTEVSTDGRYTFCSGYQAYDNEQKVCHDLQERGPCEEKMWYVRDRSGMSLTCVKECDKQDQTYNWETGHCEDAPPTTPAHASVFIPGDCGSEENYSPLLRKCVSTKIDSLDNIG